MWRILRYNHPFSAYFDHSIRKQPKTEEHLIYLCKMDNAFLKLLSKNNDDDAFSLNLPIFNIYLLCIK